ncbi:exodeoxyribonuclease VII large subunit [Wohlfahrtiimonas larvae]|uniref:Exodeoxyribonuclease 7 large subunit n=1 Tax=Wohlfahrtiimonas larvae TaxID=1157986 RepID=A0ABP9MHI2_9GAMM
MFQEMKYITVSELNQQIKFQLEGSFFHCLVEGEISNVIRAQSGHIYFNLKDANSMIRCVAWRSNAMSFNGFIENGAKVEIQGKLSLYVPRGDYQVVVNRLAPLGRGNLYLAFEQLREKLQKEGLFNPEHKKLIPQYPKKIGIVTSPNAAALQDVLKVLKDHRPDIPYEVYPTLVQGIEAAPQIVKAMERANYEANCDVLLVVRGGGSIEDLWCFNDERVVRAIFASTIPVITGVGHEVDTTLSDFVADLRAPTPTAAAKLSSISQQEIMQTLDRCEYQLIQLMQNSMAAQEKALKERMVKLSYLHPMQKIKEKQVSLDAKAERLCSLMRTIHQKNIAVFQNFEKRLQIGLLTRKQIQLTEQLTRSEVQLNKIMQGQYQQLEKRLHNSVLLLDSLSPLKVLARGYSVTQKNDEGTLYAINSVESLTVGDQLVTRLSDGVVRSAIIDLQKTRK